MFSTNASIVEGNYLRVRGEYVSATPTWMLETELPPRARRIPLLKDAGQDVGGTTSACAENTQSFFLHEPTSGNYLRVRGEYRLSAMAPTLTKELPPRARRIP